MTAKKLILFMACAVLICSVRAKGEAFVLEEGFSSETEIVMESPFAENVPSLTIEEEAAQQAALETSRQAEEASLLEQQSIYARQALEQQAVLARLEQDAGLLFDNDDSGTAFDKTLFTSDIDAAVIMPEEDFGESRKAYDEFRDDRPAIETAGRELRAKVKAHKNEISIEIDCKNEYNVEDLLKEVEKAAFAPTGDPTEGDYLRYSVAEHHMGGSSKTVTEKACRYVIHTWWEYYLELEQEDELSGAVEETVWNLSLEGMSERQKVDVVYRYVYGASFYDYQEERISHTAYASMFLGKSVCQGDALLLSRLLWEAGIPNGIVTGGSHMWNLVQVDGLYYNCDVTYEKTKGDGSTYFLKTDEEIASDHVKDPVFMEEEYLLLYPLAGK